MGKKKKLNYKDLPVPEDFYEYKCHLTLNIQKKWLVNICLFNLVISVLNTMMTQNIWQSVFVTACGLIPIALVELYLLIYKKKAQWCNIFSNLSYLFLFICTMAQMYALYIKKTDASINMVYLYILLFAYMGTAISNKANNACFWLAVFTGINIAYGFLFPGINLINHVFIYTLIYLLTSGLLLSVEKILLIIYIENIEAEEKRFLDALTRLYTRKGTKYFAKNDKINKAGAIAIFDIDFFKKVNDKYGHDKGDEVLRYFADMIKKYKSFNDIAIRWGGEEVVLYMPDITEETAYQKADNIRMKIKQDITSPVSISISGGVTAVTAGEDLEAAIKRADTGLYYAKENGRNQIKLVFKNG